MHNYKPLNDNFINYGIKKLVWEELFHQQNRILNGHEIHGWINLPINEIFTSAGLDYFTSKNIKLRPTTRLFKCMANQAGGVHADSDFYDAAFNFVVKGYGVMEWVTPVDGEVNYPDYVTSSNKQGSYKRAINYKDLTINESWNGNAALVKISSFHRIVGGKEDRYCVSVRPSEEHFFQDLLSIV